MTAQPRYDRILFGMMLEELTNEVTKLAEAGDTKILESACVMLAKVLWDHTSAMQLSSSASTYHIMNHVGNLAKKIPAQPWEEIKRQISTVDHDDNENM